MADEATPHARTYVEKTRAWIAQTYARAVGGLKGSFSGGGPAKLFRAALGFIGALTALGVAVAVGVGLVLIVFRAGGAVADAFLGAAPFLGRAIGFVFVVTLILGCLIAAFAALSAGLRVASNAISKAGEDASKTVSTQAEKYVTGALLAVLPSGVIYGIATQSQFQALPEELRYYLLPLLLPLAIGGVAGPVWGRGQAIGLTLLCLLGVAGILVGVGYLEPSATAFEPEDALFSGWVALMQQASTVQRVLWLGLLLLAIVVWTIAVFVAYREPRLVEAEPISAILVPARDPWNVRDGKAEAPAPVVDAPA